AEQQRHSNASGLAMPRTTDWSELLPLTPLSDDDLEWLVPRLEMSRPKDGLRAFCLDGYDARCQEEGVGAEYDRLAEAAGRYPSLMFVPIGVGMLIAYSAARWVDPESPLPLAVHDIHAEAVFRQMSGGIIG